MSKLLRTEDEWHNVGYVPIAGEVSLHKDKHGNFLWRPDQVEKPWEENNGTDNETEVYDDEQPLT